MNEILIYTSTEKKYIYNLSLYEYPNGTSIETSRGCLAKCTFCAETHFWKFRSTTAERTVEQMQTQIDKYGVERFWFVDSLANGNFKEFKRLIELLKEGNYNIKWNSYARNDGRMDLQMFKDIKATGCTTLSFGVESGSQKLVGIITNRDIRFAKNLNQKVESLMTKKN